MFFKLGCVSGAAIALVCVPAIGQCVPQWRAFSPGLPAPTGLTVNVLSPWQPGGTGRNVLVAGGLFSSIGGVTAANLAVWNGSAWSDLGGGTNGEVRSMFVANVPDCSNPANVAQNQLLVGGSFTRVGATQQYAYLARWNGTAWNAFPTLNPCSGTASNYGSVTCMTMFDPDGPGPAPSELIIGGEFTSSNGVNLNSIARWDGCAWRQLGSGLFNPNFCARPEAMVVWDVDGPGPGLPKLIVGGVFQFAGGLAAPSLAAWDGSTWTRLSTNFTGSVQAMTLWDPDGPGPLTEQLIVGGVFSIPAVNGTAVNIARYDGANWYALGAGLDSSSYGSAFAMRAWNLDPSVFTSDRLIVGGAFTHSGLTALNRAGVWDGSAWQALDVGLGAPSSFLGVRSIVPWTTTNYRSSRPTLAIGGDFATAGGVPSARIAMYGCFPGPCAVDINADGSVGPDDLFSFLALWFGMSAQADFNHVDGVTVQDLFDFLAAWNGGC